MIKKTLNTILERTAESQENEWGTFYYADKTGDIVVIKEILDPDYVIEKGMIADCKPKTYSTNLSTEEEEKFQGMHHFHVDHKHLWKNAMNYYINHTDRGRKKNNLNLLSFNMPEGPELIAYNTLDTFLPVDKSKKTLVRASHEQILQYLSA